MSPESLGIGPTEKIYAKTNNGGRGGEESEGGEGRQAGRHGMAHMHR